MTLQNEFHSSRVASVPKQLSACRLDRAAAELFPEFSRSLLSKWIRAGRLTLGGHVAAAKDKVVEGDLLRLVPELTAQATEAAPQPMQLSILFEDEALIVLDKPSGLVVHPGAGHRDGTLMNGLLHHRPQLRHLPRAGLVHRLDANTSGLMLVAASLPAYTRLVESIAARTVGREYEALVEGVMVAGTDLGSPIGRHPQKRTKQAVREDGRPALTKVRVKERFAAHTLVDARLHTGRTHQIRVHLSHAGFPVVGDTKYGARGILPKSPSPELREGLQRVTRQMLHARRLRFNHPIDDSLLEFNSQPSRDMQNLLSLLRDHAN